MKHTRFLAFAALIFAAPLFAFAATIETGKTVSIPGTENVYQNAYVAGGDVTFSSTAQKDLTAAGGTVTVNGSVWGDALLAGGTVQVLDEVRGDLRAAGGQVTISGPVRGDVLVAGGTVSILKGSVVAGDLIVAGGTVNMEGTINGTVRAYGGDVTINGTVAGDASIKAGKSVSFGDQAVMGGAVVYSAPQEASVADGAKIGDHVTFTKNDVTEHARGFAGVVLGILGFLFIAKFVAILVAALVFVLVFRPYAQAMTERSVAHFWKKAGIGFAALVVTPVALVVLALSFIGIYLAFFLLLAYLLALVFAGIYMCVLAGGIISQWTKKEVRTDWHWTLLGTVVVFLIAFVPFVGWIAEFLFFVAALGAVVLSIHRDAKEKMR